MSEQKIEATEAEELSVAEQIDDMCLRIDHIIPLQFAMNMGVADTVLADFIDQDLIDSEEVKSAEPFARILRDLGDDYDAEEFVEYLDELKPTGFLGHVSKPVFDYMPSGNPSFSWGYTHIGWVYAETVDGLLTAAIAWGKASEEADRKESAKRWAKKGSK